MRFLKKLFGKRGSIAARQEPNSVKVHEENQKGATTTVDQLDSEGSNAPHGKKEVTASDMARYRMMAVAESRNVGGTKDDQLAYYVGKILELLMANHGLNKEEAEKVLMTEMLPER